MPPGLGELLPVGVIGDGLVVGEDHRDQSRVAGSLDVVLSAKRMEPGAGATDVAGGQAQRDQTSGVVGAGDMLRDAHAPEDDHRSAATGRRGATDRVGDRFDLLGRHTADGRGLLGAVIVGDQGLEFVEPLGVGCDVVAVEQSIAAQHVQQRVVEGDVSAGANLSEMASDIGDRIPSDVDDDQVGARLGRLLDEGGGHRVVGGGVGAGDQCDVSPGDIGKDVGHGS